MASRFATPNTFGPVLEFMCKQGDPICQKSDLMGSVETSAFQLKLNLPYSPYLRHMLESSAFYLNLAANAPSVRAGIRPRVFSSSKTYINNKTVNLKWHGYCLCDKK